MKLLRFHFWGSISAGGGHLQEFCRFFLILPFFKLTVLDIEEKNCKTVRMRQTSNTKLEAKMEKREKRVYPCSNEDHTATNIPHTNILRHLIAKLRVNHRGDCETYHPKHTPTQTFIISMLI